MQETRPDPQQNCVLPVVLFIFQPLCFCTGMQERYANVTAGTSDMKITARIGEKQPCAAACWQGMVDSGTVEGARALLQAVCVINCNLQNQRLTRPQCHWQGVVDDAGALRVQ